MERRCAIASGFGPEILHRLSPPRPSLAQIVPSGAKATAHTFSSTSRASIPNRGSGESVSQTVICPSLDPAAIVRPSGLKATVQYVTPVIRKRAFWMRGL